MMMNKRSINVEQFQPSVASSGHTRGVSLNVFRSGMKFVFYGFALIGISPLLPVIALMYSFKFLDEAC